MKLTAKFKKPAMPRISLKAALRDTAIVSMFVVAATAPFIHQYGLLEGPTAQFAERGVLEPQEQTPKRWAQLPAEEKSELADFRRALPAPETVEPIALAPELEIIEIAEAPVKAPYLSTPGIEEEDVIIDQDFAPEDVYIQALDEVEAGVISLEATEKSGPLQASPLPVSRNIRPENTITIAEAEITIEEIGNNFTGKPIAIVLTAVGLRPDASQQAIERLPRNVTLAFAPVAPRIEDWLSRAAADGHTLLIEAPMEPVNYPETNPGPLTLLRENSKKENISRLNKVLAKAPNAIGVANYLGARFTSDDKSIAPVLGKIHNKGLVFFENQPSAKSKVSDYAGRIGMRYFQSDLTIDKVRSETAMEKELLRLEKIADEKGYAIGVGVSYPSTVDALMKWLPEMKARGYRLVPITQAEAGNG